MRRSLLVDWDNICGALERNGLRCHEADEVLGRVRWRLDDDAELVTAAVVVPRNRLTTAEAHRLERARFQVVETGRHKQAADTFITARAFEDHFRRGVEEIVILSGDGGFVTTAERLEASGARCAIWPVGAAGAARDILDRPSCRLLSEITDLAPCPGAVEQPLWDLLVACHLLTTRERTLHGYDVALRDLADFPGGVLGDRSAVEALWQRGMRHSFFAKEPRPDGAKRLRRLRYEAPGARRMFAICDELLSTLALRERLGAPAIERQPESLFTAVARHPLHRAGDSSAALEALWTCGVVAIDRQGVVSSRAPFSGLGLGRLLRRLAIMAIGEVAAGNGEPERETLDAHNLARRWPRHAAPGTVDASARRLLTRSGGPYIRFAAAQCVLERVGGRRYRLRPGHPVLAHAREALPAVLQAAVEQTAAAGPEIDKRALLERCAALPRAANGEPLAGWTHDDREDLLGSLIAERHLVAQGGRLRLGRTRLVQSLFAVAG